MLVPKGKYCEALRIAAETAEGQTVSDPKDPSTLLGPAASGIQFDKIQGLIAKGIEEGAKVLVRSPGKPKGLDHRYYVRPTIFANVTNDMTVARKEIFGPVLCILPY